MPLFSRSFRLLALPGLALTVLSGCATTSSPCGGDTQYLEARERPPLQLPAGVTGSEKLGGTMKIPPASPEAAKLDPQPRCLDEPPSYFGTKAVGKGSAEETVYIWGAAWANRKPDQVAAFYSPQFETSEEGGAAAYIAKRKDEVANGDAPDGRLEEMKSREVSPDRKVLTFVQRFGKKAYAKELTLAKDAQGWRIIAERTVSSL